MEGAHCVGCEASYWVDSFIEAGACSFPTKTPVWAILSSRTNGKFGALAWGRAEPGGS